MANGIIIEEHVLPAEVELVMSALEAGAPRGHGDLRSCVRLRYRVVASLQLFSDPPGSAPREIYTRDIGPRGMGFVSPGRLPLGSGGIIELVDPDGQTVRVHCTLLRCREAAPGWYEGALYFNREQSQFRA